ncbi:MAG: VOC family protein [Thiobacillaceae bacterium]|nr:VOC family protein [Thiobacillaceae bacterium]
MPEGRPSLRFHHLGYACAQIKRELPHYLSLGYYCEGERFVDVALGVAGQFLIGGGPRLELLENLPGSTTLDPWLAQGIKCYHLAYEVEDLAQALVWVSTQRGRVTVHPTTAVAFGGRRVMFALMRNMQLFEFIEA